MKFVFILNFREFRAKPKFGSIFILKTKIRRLKIYKKLKEIRNFKHSNYILNSVSKKEKLFFQDFQF